jgi:hypothetical protein
MIRLPLSVHAVYAPPRTDAFRHFGNQVDLYNRAATCVHKILNGAKSADLAVEQTIRAKFIINVKSATLISLAILRELLELADKVLDGMLQCEKPSVKRVAFLHR